MALIEIGSKDPKLVKNIVYNVRGLMEQMGMVNVKNMCHKDRCGLKLGVFRGSEKMKRVVPRMTEGPLACIRPW